MTDEPVTEYEIEPDVFPAELLALDRWFVWKLDDGRKIPRAPWQNSDHTDKYVSWKETENWTDFETANEWVEKAPGYGHASCIPPRETESEERLIFFDFDNCRDPDSGAIHPVAWDFIFGDERDSLHGALSTSGTGLHGYAWASIPEGYKPAFTYELDGWEYSDNLGQPELEVYAGDRFLALTGEHIASTPVGLPELSDTVHRMFHRFGSERVTGTERKPERSREELADLDTTTDVEDVYDAIAQTRPRDIRLSSTLTNERADGTKSMDPSWASSESGTRLAQFDDHWLYRKGNHRLDALQVVALEERIITDAGTYPSGDDFVEAVDALRNRGADIPKLVQPDRQGKPEVSAASEAQAGADQPKQATDGGVAVSSSAAVTSTPEPDEDDHATEVQRRFNSRVLTPLDPPEEWDGETISEKVAAHRTAEILDDEFHWVHPREDTRGWRATLYNYVPEEGIYEPHGAAEAERLIERFCGPVASNQFVNEVVGKLERRNRVNDSRLGEAPERLVVENGILDLTTGDLDDHTPDEYHKSRVDVPWRPDADTDAVDDFLHDVVDSRDVDRLYRFVAHSLYKGYPGEKAAMLLGEGRNGKSMFLELVEEFLGEFNTSHQPLRALNEDRWATAYLNGKLANIVPDMSDQSPNSMQQFKALTGGDTVSGDVKFEQPVRFTNSATLLFACNEMPVLNDDTRGNWRRWQLIDFPYTFDNDDPDAKDSVPKDVLRDRLFTEDEFAGLLRRAVDEINRWASAPDEPFFPDADHWKTTRAKMRRAAEPVYDFAKVCLRPAEDSTLRKEDVRECYRKYATKQGLTKFSDEEFGKRLLALSDFNIESSRIRDGQGRVNTYEGVEFSDRGRAILNDGDPDSADQVSMETAVEEDPSTRSGRVLKAFERENEDRMKRGELVEALAHLYDLDPSTAEAEIDAASQKGVIYTPQEGYLAPT